MNRQFCVFIFDMAVVVAMKKISNDPWSAKEIYDHMNSSQRNQRGLQQSNVCGDTATGVCVRHGLMNSKLPAHRSLYTSTRPGISFWSQYSVHQELEQY